MQTIRKSEKGQAWLAVLIVVAIVVLAALALDAWVVNFIPGFPPMGEDRVVTVEQLLANAKNSQEEASKAAEEAEAAQEKAAADKKALCESVKDLGLECVEAEDPADGEDTGTDMENPPAEPAASESIEEVKTISESAVAEVMTTELIFSPFTPDWTGLSKECPSYEDVLKVHDLTSSMLEPKTSIAVNADPEIWEPCTYAIEFLPEFRGTTIQLKNGYGYDAALVGDSNQPLWGGDPKVPTVALQWGVTFRWGPSFQGETNPGRWLDPKNPRQWAVNLCKEGRYLSTPEAGLDRFPYFDRIGPWIPGTGNLDVGGWTPPEIDEFIPQGYMDAACMLGGRAVESEWTFENGNVSWKYTAKEPGSATYCKTYDFCWQTVYIPRFTTTTGGYVELWDGKAEASRKFTYSDLATLVNGQWNVDQSSYHPFGNK